MKEVIFPFRRVANNRPVICVIQLKNRKKQGKVKHTPTKRKIESIEKRMNG